MAWSPWKWLLLSNYYTHPWPCRDPSLPTASKVQSHLHTPTCHLGSVGSPRPSCPLSRTPASWGGEWGRMWVCRGPDSASSPLPCRSATGPSRPADNI